MNPSPSMSYSWNAPEKRGVRDARELLRFVLTFELLVQSAATCHTERAYEFFEIDGAVLVLVEHVEHIVREFSWITEGEELLVYATEFDLV